MIYYAKIIDNQTKICKVGIGSNIDFYKSIGMAEMEVEQAYDGNWYVSGYAPVKPEPTIAEQNEAIRATREQLYIQTSDKLKADYDEAVARGADNVEELKTAWLESKDKIREDNPYIVEESVEEAVTVEESDVIVPTDETEQVTNQVTEQVIEPVEESEVIEDGLQR